MLQLILSGVGLLMLVGGIAGLWITRRVLQNQDPDERPPLLGVVFTMAAYGIVTVSLIFNGASWFWFALSLAAAIYLAGLVVQSLGRRGHR